MIGKLLLLPHSVEICTKKAIAEMVKEEAKDNDIMELRQVTLDDGVVSSIKQIGDWLRAKDKVDGIQQQWYHVAAVIDRAVFCFLLSTLVVIIFPVSSNLMGD